MTSTTNNHNKQNHNKKNHRKHIAIGIVSLALVGGVAGTAFANTNMTQRGIAHSMSSVFHGGMMNGRSGAGHGMAMGSGGHMNTAGTPMTAAASYLGLSETELQSQMHAGKTLADIATANGKTVSGLQNALVSAMTAQVNANTNLSADQRTAMLTQISARVTTMLNTTHQANNGNGMGTGMGMGNVGGTGNANHPRNGGGRMGNITPPTTVAPTQ